VTNFRALNFTESHCVVSKMKGKPGRYYELILYSL